MIPLSEATHALKPKEILSAPTAVTSSDPDGEITKFGIALLPVGAFLLTTPSCLATPPTQFLSKRGFPSSFDCEQQRAYGMFSMPGAFLIGTNTQPAAAGNADLPWLPLAVR